MGVRLETPQEPSEDYRTNHHRILAEASLEQLCRPVAGGKRSLATCRGCYVILNQELQPLTPCPLEALPKHELNPTVSVACVYATEGVVQFLVFNVTRLNLPHCGGKLILHCGVAWFRHGPFNQSSPAR